VLLYAAAPEIATLNFHIASVHFQEAEGMPALLEKAVRKSLFSGAGTNV
jgi:hypothetical protein